MSYLAQTMKCQLYIFLTIFSFAIVGKSEPTNSFAIFLTTEPVDPRIMAYGKGDWSRVQLAESPVISEADILSYDFTNHLITLKSDAVSRLPKPPVSGTAFVLVADGQRIYLGAFMTGSSSMSVAVPSILVEPVRTNVLRIDRVYAAPYSKTDPDPRSDERVRRALSTLRKLK